MLCSEIIFIYLWGRFLLILSWRCLLIFRRGDYRGREGVMWDIDQLPPICAPNGIGTCDLGICPDWESNPQPFGVQDDAPTSWAMQPGQWGRFLYILLHSELMCISEALFWYNWLIINYIFKIYNLNFWHVHIPIKPLSSTTFKTMNITHFQKFPCPPLVIPSSLSHSAARAVTNLFLWA